MPKLYYEIGNAGVWPLAFIKLTPRIQMVDTYLSTNLRICLTNVLMILFHIIHPLNNRIDQSVLFRDSSPLTLPFPLIFTLDGNHRVIFTLDDRMTIAVKVTFA